MVSTTKFSNDISQLAPVVYTEIMDSLKRAKTNNSSHWGHAEMKSPLCNYEHKTKLGKIILHRTPASTAFGLRKAADIFPGGWQEPLEIPARKTTDLLRARAQKIIFVDRDTTLSIDHNKSFMYQNSSEKETEDFHTALLKTSSYFWNAHRCRMSSLPWNVKPVHWTWWAGQPQKASDTQQTSCLS